MVILETDRLILRDYLEADLEDMHRLWSDRDTMHYLDDIATDSIDETAKYLRIGLENADGHYFCICGKDGVYMGGVGYTITEISPLGKVVHMGFMMLPEFHGRGFMTEAVKKVIEFAFMQDSCVRITTGCHSEHTASSRVIEKAGFRRIEGEANRLEYALNKNEFWG
ncbi:MAG: GNAT family N-acetyltransferase [Clostridiales bacterium]|jgi:ribosomal-protein-alanine N-acetyltransferase|nr:GNAT family N-acetyltransferase [Clostridiales bacterium]